MKKRAIVDLVRGRRAVDGAGVQLTRVLGYRTTQRFDPFLMLDSFDSADPADYIAGFPTHPHRGIETITYLIAGEMEHEDSLGNRGVIGPGESQWMTAGRGILHQEMPRASERMLGVQLWLSLPRAEKLAEPAYLSITPEMMATVEQDGVQVRVLSGSFAGVQGVTPGHLPATIYDLSIPAGGSIRLPTDPAETVFVFTILGDGMIDGQLVAEKTAVLFGEGECVEVAAQPGEPLRCLFFSAPPLGEPIAWGGPIVMNTQQELDAANDELRRGTFIK